MRRIGIVLAATVLLSTITPLERATSGIPQCEGVTRWTKSWRTISLPFLDHRSIYPTGNTRVGSFAVDPSAPGRLFVGTQDGRIMSTTDGGCTWNEALLNQKMAALSIAHDVFGTFWQIVVGKAGIFASARYIGIPTVFSSTDGGKTWVEHQIATAMGQTLASIATPSEEGQTLYALTKTSPVENGVEPVENVYASSDAGATWELRGSFTTGTSRPTDIIVDPLDESKLWAWTLRNSAPEAEPSLWSSTDGGRQWQAMSVNPAPGVEQVQIFHPAGGATRVVALSGFRYDVPVRLIVSDDEGASWTEIAAPNETQNVIFGATADQIVALGGARNPRAFRYEYRAGRWVDIGPPPQRNATFEDRLSPASDGAAKPTIYMVGHGPYTIEAYRGRL